MAGRFLACCISCEKHYVVNTNDFNAVKSYEEIPEDLQEKAKDKRLNSPGSQLFSFGGCDSCKKIGWPKMKKVPFQGIPN